jgi:hypothetical protein
VRRGPQEAERDALSLARGRLEECEARGKAVVRESAEALLQQQQQHTATKKVRIVTLSVWHGATEKGP